jgi:hypothetical protein
MKNVDRPITGCSSFSFRESAPREDDSSLRPDLERSTPNRNLFMKFVSLGKDRAHKQGKLDTPACAILEPTKPIAVPHQIHTYTELQQQIHDDLRIQHPEWVQPNGESPMCDSYESRLMELLGSLMRRESNESIASPPRALEQELYRIKAATV